MQSLFDHTVDPLGSTAMMEVKKRIPAQVRLDLNFEAFEVFEAFAACEAVEAFEAF